MDQLIHAILSYLPPDLQNIALNPPSLDSPSSFLPLIRFAWPFAKGLVVLLAFYIVWATLSGAFGYFARFLRFTLKIGPIIGFIAWIMGASAQGSMGDMVNLARQWAGLGGPGAQGAGPGLASLAGLFSGDQAGTRPNTRSKTRNTRPAQNGGPDIMSSIFNTAANWMGQGEGGGGWQNIVQDYVKQAMDSAAAPPPTEEDTKRKRKTKGW